MPVAQVHHARPERALLDEIALDPLIQRREERPARR
jgi:hypothetical protein